MKRAIPMAGGIEYDYLTRFRRWLCKGTVRRMSAYAKRKFRRRERRYFKKELRNDLETH